MDLTQTTRGIESIEEIYTCGKCGKHTIYKYKLISCKDDLEIDGKIVHELMNTEYDSKVKENDG